MAPLLSLRFRLLLLVLVAIGPAVGLLLYSNLEQRRQAASAALEDAMQLAEVASSDQAQLLGAARQLLSSLAQLPAVQNHDARACSAFFASVMRGSDVYTNLFAAKPNGDAFCSGRPLPHVVNFGDQPHFQHVLQAGGFAIGGYLIGRASGKPILALAHGAVDASGGVRAVVLLGVDLRSLSRLVAMAGVPQGSVLTVVDRSGVILARYPDPERWIGTPEAPIVRDMLTRGRGAVEAAGLDGVRRFYAFLPLRHREGPLDVYVSVGIPADIALAKANRALAGALLGIGLVCALALGAAWVAADRLVVRPVRTLVDATERLGAGDLSARTGLAHKRGELGQLAGAFDEMASALEAQAAQLGRLNRALRTLSECNERLVRATEESELLREICRVIVDVGGYRRAWVGFTEPDEAKTVRPAAHAGHAEGDLEAVDLGRADPEGGPAALAIRSARPAVVRDISTDPALAPWRQAAAARGYASVIALPLIAEGRPFGALVIWAAELGRFDIEEEATLLSKLADDLAYGIVALRTRVERVRVEEELKRQQEALYQREKLAEMGSLLAGVAHELNNPLSVVIGRAALLGETVGDGPLARHAHKIADAANRCSRIVKNFLALARQYPPEREQVSLNQVVEDAVELLAYQLRVGNVEVELDLGPDLPPFWADGHQLHQLVVNLVTNADHAMRDVAGPRRLTLSTRYEPERARVLLGVADTGPGVPPELQQKIFEPFFTTKPAGQGTGLGLALCRGIVEGHGGMIGVDGRPGRGAIFRVELPAEKPPMGVTGAKVSALPIVRGKTVLVVDDEPEVAGVLVEMLAVDGHRVETATNGTVALAKLGEQAYDVIVSDIKMPGLDGPGLYREVERRYPDLCRRFCFMTGDALSPRIAEFLEKSEAPSLAKPFAPGEVQRVVQRILRAAGA